MIGAIIGAVGAIGSSIAGGIMSARANKKQAKEIAKQQADNEAWYARRYNEDATQRADAQRILTQTSQAIRDRNKQIAGTQAVMGGTEESVAAQREQNNQMQANAASQIAANAAAQKDNIDQQYRQTKANLSAQKAGLEAQKQQNIATATSGALQGMAQIAGSLDQDTSVSPSYQDKIDRNNNNYNAVVGDLNTALKKRDAQINSSVQASQRALDNMKNKYVPDFSNGGVS